MALIVRDVQMAFSGDGDDFTGKPGCVLSGPHRSELEHNAADRVRNSVKSIPFCAVVKLSRPCIRRAVVNWNSRSGIVVAPRWNV